MTTSYTNSISYLVAKQLLDAKSAGIINTMLYGVSPLSLVPIVPTSDFMEDKWYELGYEGADVTSKRRLNEEPDPTFSQPYKAVNERTGMFYRSAAIDKKIVEEKGPEAFDDIMIRHLQYMRMNMDRDFFNGAVASDGTGFNGLKARVAIGSTYDLNNGGALTINTDASTMKDFLDLFRAAVDSVHMAPGTQLVAFTTKQVKRAITAGRDMLGANVAGVAYTDILNKRVMTVDDIPLVTVEKDSTGTDILGLNENGESSTSIWLVSYGGGATEGGTLPNGAVILSAGNGQFLRQRPFEGETQYRVGLEIEMGLRTPPGSVVRVSRLKVA